MTEPSMCTNCAGWLVFGTEVEESHKLVQIGTIVPS